MQTALKVFVILAIAVIISLGLYVLVQTQFSMSMGPGGFSPGFALLLKMRAAENGGQIAPSFEELGVSGSSPFGAGGPGGLPGALGEPKGVAITKDLDLGKAPGASLHDILRMAVAILLAVLLEIGVTRIARSRRSASAQS